MDIKKLDTIGKRISFLLDMKNLKNIDLAKAINKAPNTVSNYINDERTPDVYTLKSIAQFLNVNTDFLLMLSDDYQTYVSREVNGDLFEIVFDDEKLHLTEKEISDLFEKLKSVGFDVKKLL